jgi:hypothetical protein
MLAVAVERLNASGTDSDDGLDRLIGELPDRIATTERLLAEAFVPPLWPPSGPGVAPQPDDLGDLETL